MRHQLLVNPPLGESRMKKTSRRKQRPRNANAYGISRKIPEDIKQQVRVRSGFGCVLCREIPCDYDHFEPEFKDLKTPHSAEGIALLCARHHAEKTRGFLRAEKVKAAYLIGQANGWPPIQFLGGFQPELPISVAIANKKFTGRSSIIIHGFNILDVRYDPTAKSFLLNLTVIEKNQVIVQIVDNVLISAPQKLVDFKNTSTTFSIFTSRPPDV